MQQTKSMDLKFNMFGSGDIKSLWRKSGHERDFSKKDDYMFLDQKIGNQKWHENFNERGYNFVMFNIHTICFDIYCHLPSCQQSKYKLYVFFGSLLHYFKCLQLYWSPWCSNNISYYKVIKIPKKINKYNWIISLQFLYIL